MSEVRSGNLVEWWQQPSSIRTGIVANAPAVRRIGQVALVRGEWATVYDEDGIRAMVQAEKLTVLAETAFAGWAIKFREGGL